MLKIYQNLFRGKETREVLWSFLSKGVSVFLFILTNVILARALSVEEFGSWSFFLSIITLVFTISFFGINSSTRKYVAQYNETIYLKNILVASLKLRFIFSLIFSFVFLISYKKIAVLLNHPELETLFLFGTLLVFFSGIVEYFKSIFQGLHRIKYNFILSFFEFSLKLVLVIIFLFFSRSIISVVNSFIIALFITALAGFYLFLVNFYKNINIKKSDRSFTKDIFNYGIPFVFISLGFIALTEIDTIMLGVLSETREVGIYAIAKQIVIKLPHITLAIAIGVMPIFAKLEDDNRQKLKKKFIGLLKLNSILFIFITLALIILSPLFLPLLFGNEYAGSVLPLQILSIYLFFFSTSILLSNLLDYAGKAGARAVNILITIALNILLNYLLIPKYGATGAAIATTLSYLPYIFLNLVEARKVFSDSNNKIGGTCLGQ